MWIVCYADNSHQMPSFIFSEKKKKQRKKPRNVFVISVLRIKPFLIKCAAAAHKRISVSEIALLFKRCKVHWKLLPPKLDFNAEIQNFIEYFYPLNFSFNADFQNFIAEIPFTPSYLEVWQMRRLI